MKNSMMKHLLSIAIICLMSVPAVLAQTFEFRYHGEPVPDGGTVTIFAEMNEFEELACETNPPLDPGNGLILSLLAGNTLQGNATIIIEENTLNPERVLWCMGGSCMNLGTETNKTKSFTFEQGRVLTQFDAINIRSEGVLLATLSATVGTETHSVIIKFVNGDVAVAGDVNGDSECTGSDVTALYNYILYNDSSAIVNGDQNGDGEITGSDVTAVYNIILGVE